MPLAACSTRRCWQDIRCKSYLEHQNIRCLESMESAEQALARKLLPTSVLALASGRRIRSNQRNHPKYTFSPKPVCSSSTSPCTFQVAQLVVE